MLERVCGTCRHLVVVNKCDLAAKQPVVEFNGALVVRLSAKTGEGLEALREAIRAFLGGIAPSGHCR